MILQKHEFCELIENNYSKNDSTMIDTILEICEELKIDVENIKVEKRDGGSLEDSELIEGIVLDKEVVNANMPKSIKNAKIALVDAALEIKGPETDAKIQITEPSQ